MPDPKIYYQSLRCVLFIGYLIPALARAEQDSTETLEQQLSTIDTELASLAHFKLRSGVGNIGWISAIQRKPNSSQWAHITLMETTTIDQVVLVPVLWNDAERGPQADGFPVSFEIVIGTKADPKGQVVARRGPEDAFLPRLAPLVINIPPTRASWIRVRSTQLAPHARNGDFRFKLSEIMVFSKTRNVALRQPVRVSSNAGGWGASAIYKEALVDGLTPYLMDAAGERKGSPYMARATQAYDYYFNIDLDKRHDVDGIRLHSAFIDEYIPQINPVDFGLPQEFTVYGANLPDFSDAQLLLNYRRPSIYQAGNILEWKFPTASCRYIRFTVSAHAWPQDAQQKEYYISLDEFEVLSQTVNVSKNKAVQFSENSKIRNVTASRLTDGLNHFGDILSSRVWMEQLARRHDLQLQRPMVAEKLNQQYARQKENLRSMYQLVALLVATIVFIILVDRMLRLRVILKTRERIAANLHDELSANLHALSLLGDVARKNINVPDRLSETLDRIQQLTQRNRDAARHCTNMLQSNTLGENLAKEMRYCADRLLSSIQHEFTVQGEAHLQKLTKGKRNDIYLFFQECLTNIARHAGATECQISITGSADQIQLVVTDDGSGVTQTPPSLQRRARMLKAEVKAETPDGRGTQITLTLSSRRFLRF